MINHCFVTGNLTKETIFNLLYNINTKGFVWRGFTNRENEMVPSAAFYGVNNGQAGIGKYNKCNNRLVRQPIIYACFQN